MKDNQIEMKSSFFNVKSAIVSVILIFFIFSVYNHISLNQSNNKCKVNSIELEDRVEVLDTQNKALQDSKVKCQRKINLLETKVSEMADLKKKISDMKTSQESQASALSKENESLKSQLQQLQSDYKQLSEKGENLEASNQRLTKEKETEINQLKTENENEIAVLRDQIANLKRREVEPPKDNNEKKPFVKKGGDDKDIVNEQINPPKDPQKMKESYGKLAQGGAQNKDDADSLNRQNKPKPDGPEVPNVDDTKKAIDSQAAPPKHDEPLDSDKLGRINKPQESNNNNPNLDANKNPDQNPPVADQPDQQAKNQVVEEHQNILPKPNADDSQNKNRAARIKREGEQAANQQEDLEPRKIRRQRILDEGQVNSEDGDPINSVK